MSSWTLVPGEFRWLPKLPKEPGVMDLAKVLPKPPRPCGDSKRRVACDGGVVSLCSCTCACGRGGGRSGWTRCACEVWSRIAHLLLLLLLLHPARPLPGRLAGLLVVVVGVARPIVLFGPTERKRASAALVTKLGLPHPTGAAVTEGVTRRPSGAAVSERVWPRGAGRRDGAAKDRAARRLTSRGGR